VFNVLEWLIIDGYLYLSVSGMTRDKSLEGSAERYGIPLSPQTRRGGETRNTQQVIDTFHPYTTATPLQELETSTTTTS